MNTPTYPTSPKPWQETARPNQLPPEGDWHTWLILAGRGFGKTRTGAETVKMWVEEGRYRRIALIGKSVIETRQIMVDGPSGILSLYEEDHPNRPKFEVSRRRLVWPSGAVAEIYGGDTPERLRGPQFDLVWIDELAKFRKPTELMEQVEFCLRLGENPRIIITTTPKAISLIEELLAEEGKGVVVSKGTTFDNQANLSKRFIEKVQKMFSETRLGAQELYGEVLSEREGALWKRDMIDHKKPPGESWKRIVVAVDPAVTNHDQSDETGIIVAAQAPDGTCFVLDDLSGKFSVSDWTQRVINAFKEYKADRVVVESNKGGDLVQQMLKSYDAHIPIKSVRATRGKITRAEPVAALYEQGKVKHARPYINLEKQMCEYVAGTSQKSPDRMDALVWGLTDLVLAKEADFGPKIWNL
jgi:predicted phage terminase large subunit-like protein